MATRTRGKGGGEQRHDPAQYPTSGSCGTVYLGGSGACEPSIGGECGSSVKKGVLGKIL
jgi:hypothetical protein